MANIRESDAILQVVRVFEDGDITHVHGEVNPQSDIEVINSELILADLETLEKRIAKDGKKAKKDKDLARQIQVMEKLQEALTQGKLCAEMELSEEEKEDISDLHLLTNKQFVYACNVSEDMMDSSEEELKNIL